MNEIILILLLIQIQKTCKIIPPKNSPEIIDQINLAGLIISGKASKIIKKENYKYSIEIENPIFYRGSEINNNNKIIINGFSDTAACGSGIPKINNNYFFFFCDKKINNTFEFFVHRFFIGTGFIFDNEENKNLVLNRVKDDKLKKECGTFEFGYTMIYDKIILIFFLIKMNLFCFLRIFLFSGFLFFFFY